MRPKKTTKSALSNLPARRALGLATGMLDVAVRNLEHVRRIANFLRGLGDFEVRQTDVFVSSYPRSGTTWTQWILYLLTHEGQPDPEHLTRASPWFERSLASGELTASDLERFASPRVFKSHLPREWLPDGARYIYVERNVQDVLVSYYHFYRDYLGFRGSFDDFYRRFMDGRVQYGSWFDHVAGWQEHENDPAVLIVRYEELLSDRQAAIRDMAEFLLWDVSTRSVERAVTESSFEAMKRREAVFDHATAILLERGVTRRSFLRLGASAQDEGLLTHAQSEELRTRGPSGSRLAIRGLAAFLQ